MGTEFGVSMTLFICKTARPLRLHDTIKCECECECEEKEMRVLALAD